MSDSRPRGPPALVALLVAVALAAVAVVWTRARRQDRAIAARVDALLTRATASPGAGAPANATVTDDDLTDLPAPVRRYLESVLDVEQPSIRTVRMRQQGELRVGDDPGSWKPFEATQHVAVDPPGFVWDATVAVLPFLPARVVDAYEAGAGSLEARLLSAISVAAAGPTPEMDEGELLRYLAESVWYPTALLADGVAWEAIDDRAARATIEDGGTSASLVFRFDDRGLVESVHAEGRYRQEDDDYAPWTGYYRGYEERSGLLVPTEAEVAWTQPGGDRPYWRARVEAVDYGTAE